MTPGIRVVDALQVVASNSYTSDNGGWVVVEVENISGEILPNVQLSASLLDSQNRELDTQTTISPFLNIPPGYVVPLVLPFLTPPDYTNFFALVEVERQTGNSANYIGEFDLPVVVNQPDSLEFPLMITGTINNDRGVTLITPVAAVTVFDDAGNLLGTALAALDGHNERGEWVAGSDLTFQASFSFLPSTAIGEIRVRSAGYRIQ
ncbi:MAG TPA: hypothetical protein VJZ27_17975 [Aggregatilineales bacterium]|nr:hypothetical protein [Aggregatilineales bacterium]